MRSSEQGVALLTVLTMVVMISVLAGSIAIMHHHLIQASERTYSQSQAFQYILAAEQLALTQLALSSTTNTTNNSATSAAARISNANLMTIPVMPVEGGSVSMVLQPKSDCFNLNNLVQDGKPSEGARMIWQNMLNRANVAKISTDSIVDWLDSDDVPLADGAESSYYLSLNPPYSPTNGPMIHIGDVTRIKGINKDEWLRVASGICVLPQNLPIDVNSAPASLLANLDGGLNINEVASWVQQRDTVPIHLTTLDEFWKIPAFSKVSADNQKKLANALTVQGQVYRLLTTVQLGQRRRQVESVIVKENNLPQVVGRKWK